MLSSEAGMGETLELFIYNQVKSLWLMLVPQETKSGLRQHTAGARGRVHVPVPGQGGNYRNKKIVKLKKKDIKVNLVTGHKKQKKKKKKTLI